MSTTQFNPGDKVRIHLSPECPLPKRPRGLGYLVEHYPEQDGLEGEICDLPYPSENPTHLYFVLLPETSSPDDPHVKSSAGYFAASELELIL